MGFLVWVMLHIISKISIPWSRNYYFDQKKCST